MPIYQLNEHLVFPPAELADPDGLLAIGGDLRPTRLVLAYSRGVFPWPHDELPLLWFSPDPRTVLKTDGLRISRSLRARLRRGTFEVRFDTAFRQVVEGCARTPRNGQAGTWITPEILESYCGLHRHGLAHSAEAWRDGRLVGGLYGVSLGAAFFGESMFAREADASKAALAVLVGWLAERGFHFVDCQMHSAHLGRLGAVRWNRARYLRALGRALEQPTLQGCWADLAPERMATERVLVA